MSIQSDITNELLVKFPNRPLRQLSRIAYKENPKAFLSLDSAYQLLRYYSGTHGKLAREKIPEEMIRSPEIGKVNHKNPYGIPPSDADNWHPIKFPITKGNGLFIADIHIPYHDIKALTIAYGWALDNGFTDFIFIDGDLNDSYQLSRFERDPRKRDYKSELDITNKYFNSLEKTFPNSKIIIKKGNHDYWLERYLKVKAPELLGIKDFLYDKYLHIKERGIILYEHDIPLRIGKLNILHGHEYYGTQTVVNPARGIYLKTRECAIVAHWHRTSMHTETSLNRRWDTTWSVGCMCCLWPEYSRLNQWNHGFAGLSIDGKDFTIRNERIINGTVR